jgi:hypothetical protein
MANSRPVVNTKVGSIPIFFKDSVYVILIKPKNISEIVKYEENIFSDSELRQILIGGFKLLTQKLVLQ